MKISTSSRLKRGFTLMELLVVITLIAILAGMVLAAMPGILSSIKRKSIVAFLGEIEGGLDEYRIDNGLYPLNPEGAPGGGGGGPSGDDVAIQGAVILYRNLSGDYDMDTDGIVDDDTKVYVDRLNYQANKPGEDGRKPPVERSVVFQSGFALVDPLGGPLRYLADAPGIPADQKRTRNPTFDLWSVAGAKPDSGDFNDEAKWITNWGGN